MGDVADTIKTAGPTPAPGGVFDLATAKVRLSITDATQDQEITAILSASKSLLEKYLDRLLDYKRETSVFYEIKWPKIWVPRYPIDQVYSVDGAPFSKTYIVHHLNGWIKGPFKNQATIDYSGGFKNWPEDLLWAAWHLFDALWDARDPQKAGAVSSSAQGAVSRVTLQDVGTIAFDTSGGSGAAGISSLGGPILLGLPISVISVLDLYRRESC